MKISVAIPCYEMHGLGAYFLEQCFTRIYAQTYKDVEVVVGDQSNNDDILKLCSKWQNKLNLKRVSTIAFRGSPSANLNLAVRETSGEIIKILFQDDLITSEDHLQNIANGFSKNPSKKWLASGFEHTKDGIFGYRPFIPTMQRRLKYGINTLGPPSTISVRRAFYEDFDDNLSWMMDLDVYSRLWQKYGEPIIDCQISIASREWGMQNTHNISDINKMREELLSLRPELLEIYANRIKEVYECQKSTNDILGHIERLRIASGTISNRNRITALERLGELFPIDYEFLTYRSNSSTSIMDTKRRDAIKLLNGYYTSEQSTKNGMKDLIKADYSNLTDDLKSLVEFYGQSKCDPDFPIRIMPSFWTNENQINEGIDEILGEVFNLSEILNGGISSLYKTSNARNDTKNNYISSYRNIITNIFQNLSSEKQERLGVKGYKSSFSVILTKKLKPFANRFKKFFHDDTENIKAENYIIIGDTQEALKSHILDASQKIKKSGSILALNLDGENIFGPHSFVSQKNYSLSLQQIF